MAKTIPFFFDIAQKLVQYSIDVIVFVTARLVGVEIGFKELRLGRTVPPNSGFNTDNIVAPSEVLDIVVDMNKREDDREKTILDKAKALLPIMSLAFAVLIAFRPLFANSKLLALPLLFTLIAIILLIRLLSLRIYTLISISQKEIEQEEVKIQKMRIKDLHNCSVHNSYSNDLLADIFRASQTYLILGAFATCVIVCIACFNVPAVDNKLEDRLKSINLSLDKIEYLKALDSLLLTTHGIANSIDTLSSNILKATFSNDTTKTMITNHQHNKPIKK